MPLQKLQFRPGVNREGTSLSNEGGWFDCDKVRFRSGYPEKIGGWAALSYNTFLGVCRSMWNWITLKQYNLLGVGTNLKFYVENGGEYYDITPIRETNLNSTTFSAVTTAPFSSTITVTDSSANSLQVGDFVTFSNAVSLGGNITAAVLNQEYQISGFISGTIYTIEARAVSDVASPGATVLSNASDVGNGGSATDAAYQISTGFDTFTISTGWGAGPWSGTVTVALTNPFTTTTGSGIVTVAHAGHTLVVGDQVVFLSASYPTSTIPSVGGLPAGCLQANFIVQSVVAGVSYTIWTNGNTATTLATSNATGGGNVVVYPPSTYIPSRGWGVGYTTGFGEQLRLWSQENFGEYLLFNARGSSMYIWQPGSGVTPGYSVRAVVLSPTSVTPAGWSTTVTDADCPSLVNQIMVSDTSRIVIAFGCNDYGEITLDPLLIRWSAQESYTDWTPAATNQAGSYRLSHGSEIIGAIQTRQEIVVWTDAAIYSMQYLGPPNVYGFTLLADNISIVSPNAMATASGVVYWMGVDKFYVYSGRVETLPCAVRTYIYNDINRDQFFQCFAGTNEGYSEVWWYYCSANSTTIDRYVIFNYLDRVWYYGTLQRTAWLDSPLRPFPQAATPNNIIVYHEAIVDNGETNPPSAIDSYIQSSDMDIGDGHNYGFVWRMLPDITFDGSTTAPPENPRVNFTMRPKQNPGAPYNVAPSPLVRSAQNYGTVHTYTVQEFTQIIYTRVRGRQLAFRIDSNTLGTSWQLGVPRMDVRPDGRR